MNKDVLLVIIAINEPITALNVEPFYSAGNLGSCKLEREGKIIIMVQ